MTNISAGQLNQYLGSPSDEQLFKMTWGRALNENQFHVKDHAMGTHDIKQMIQQQANMKELYAKTVAKAIHDFRTKSDVTMSGVASAVPIIFDPEILDILNNDTPFLDAIPKMGYQGHRVRLNRISARDDPTGAVSEVTSTDLSSVANDFTFGTVSADMKIFVDACNTSDFGQIGSEHYVNLRDTNFGERVRAHLRSMERHMLYGDASQAGASGDPFDANTFSGMAKIYTDAGTRVDKSAIASDFLGDIEKVLYSMFQSGYAIRPSDLQLWVSFSMFQALVEDMNFYGIHNLENNAIQYGAQSISIAGVPVISGDQIRAHTFQATGPTPTIEGDPGDVFIVNSRASSMRYLAPLSTLPLARIGLAEQMALFEFSTYADKAAGLFGRYLDAYNI